MSTYGKIRILQLTGNTLFKKLFRLWDKIHYSDICNADGSYLSFHDFNTFFNAKSNFLQYSGLISAIRSYQKNDGRFVKKDYNLGYPKTVIFFMNSNKGCKEMYNALILKMKELPTSETKKREEKGYYSRKEWNLIYNLPFNCTQETKLQWLQTQLLHRISATNKYLCNCNLINSALCSFCGLLPETIDHLFSECYLIKELWDKIKYWLDDLQLNVNFDNKSILVGKYLNSDIHRFENLFILIVKQYIYACKLVSLNN